MSDSNPGRNSSRLSGRLAASSSPYLLQHADNPVDWFSWGEEAFEKARSSDRPLFISIGYATCHWCHVMERESFENETVASVLNDSFVAVKVDREEHPDVDHFYMTACTAGGRRGGWPLTILALPDGRPFYAATYLPPFSAGGRAGLVDILSRIAEMWTTDRESIEEAARDVTGLVERLERLPEDADVRLDPASVDRVIERTLQQIRSEYDAGPGGFGRAPKFPVFHRLRFLLAHGNEEGRGMALRTLVSMRAGGIWDHVGHGFHRYSTDRNWHLPHFEKMLYDQAVAIAAYAEAYAVTDDPVYRNTVIQLGQMLERDFRLSDELMASAWDADSEGEEGRFYVWTRDELSDALSTPAEDPADGSARESLRFLETVFAVRAEGNFTDEATGRSVESNILDAGYESPDPNLADVIDRFEPIRRVLLEARSKRVPPLRDEKRLSDWNGLYMAGAALAGRLVASDDLVQSAERVADRLLDDMREGDGGMRHRKFGGSIGIDGGIDDYAMPALGCFELFQATGRPRWLTAADGLIGELLDRFFDEESGMLRISNRSDIPVGQTRLQDEAYSSGTGIALVVMSAMVGILDRPRQVSCLERVLSGALARIEEWPAGHLTALAGASRFTGARGEIVVAGPADHPLRSIVRRSFTPSHVHVHVTDETAPEMIRLMPFVETLVGTTGGEGAGRAAVFICSDRSCDLPITDAGRLQEALREIGYAGG